jgi:ABC-2 type transport system ATP-binding protein
MKAIITSHLAKQYGQGSPALADLSLEVEEGTVFGFLGPNGAGKTTTVRILNGTLTPTSGTFTLFSRQTDPQDIRLLSGTLSETARMYENLSALDNLRFFGSLYDLDARETEERSRLLLEKLGLRGREDDKVGTYSTGMKKRVQLARTLLHKPKLLFLDEPTSGLDPEAAGEVSELIKTVAREEGTTVFLCTHNLSMAEKVCDHVGFLDRGHLVAFGTREELTARLGKGKVLEITLRFPDGKDDETLYHRVNEESEINRHIKTAMDRGGIILESRLQRPGLEELYFSYVGVKDEK